MADRDLTSSANIVWDYSNAGQAIPQMTENDSRGSAGQVLTSNGAGQLPTFQDPASASGGGGATDFQRFNSSGTWDKPTDTAFGDNSVVLIRAWGAGGSGGRDNTDGGTGGGGGGYSERWMLLSELGSSETVTIGAGGAGVNANSNGNAGGETTFGSHLTASGGEEGLGRTSGSGAIPGGNGGSSNTGNQIGQRFVVAVDFSDTDAIFEGDPGGTASADIPDGYGGFWVGGGGGSITQVDQEGAGGDSIFGGGGGGAADGSSEPGGTSVNGGNGGASGNQANGTAGTQPGGGGGGVDGGFTSGAGADGRVDVIVWAVSA